VQWEAVGFRGRSTMVPESLAGYLTLCPERL